MEIVGRFDMGGAALEVEGLEPSHFHQVLIGVDIPVHYEWARFSTQPFTEKPTPLKELRRVVASLAEHLQICCPMASRAQSARPRAASSASK